MRRLLWALALCCAAPVTALELEALSPEQREAFRAEVRAYLLENPEVLLEAIGVLEDRQAGAQAVDEAALVAENAAALFESKHSWVGGNPEGDITLVEFVDYNCGFCRRAFPEVMELVESDGNIRLIMKEFPILGPESEIASRFAIAVLQQEGDDAYAEAHERLMTLEGRANDAVVRRIGRDMGLDMDAIAAAMESAEVTAVIEANRALAQRLEIGGTPTFVLEDRLIRGFLPADGMRELVAIAREG